MMYSMEKCLGRNGTGTPEEADLFAGGGEGLGQEGVPSDDVVLVSAVAAVSHEIGDILKDELGDAERADRIGAELADLSAELGLLAGLADGDTQQDFPTLLKLAMGAREMTSSGSSTSSSWSRVRTRRPPRPARVPRRRTIAKGKEVSRRRSAAARRAACMRMRRVEVVSDASDVGADSECESGSEDIDDDDDDDQWTELDDGSSGSSSDSCTDTSSKSGTEMEDHPAPNPAIPPQLRQFLLPLITNVTNSLQFKIRHEDILELLRTEREGLRAKDLPSEHEAFMTDEPDELSADDMFAFEEPPVTPEEEATLLHYVCGGERGSMATFQPTPEWLLGVFHSWCEVSGLIYTLIGTRASAYRVCGEWGLRIRVPCYCRLCLCRVRAEPALACLLRDLVWTLAHGGSTVPNAAHIMRALRLSGDAPLLPEEWDIPRLKRIQFSDEGAAIIHNQLVRYSEQNETARRIITTICNCKSYDKPMQREYAVERLIKILECYKSAAIVHFKVEMMPLTDDPDTAAWIEKVRPRLERYLEPLQDSLASERLHTMATTTKPAALRMWARYKHKCGCTKPKLMCAYERKQLLKSIYSRMTVFGLRRKKESAQTMLPGPTRMSTHPKKPIQHDRAHGELQQGDGTGAKPPDSVEEATLDREDEAEAEAEAEAEVEAEEETDPEESVDMDDSSFLTVTDSEEHSGTSLGLSSSSLDSASELLLAAAHAVDSDTDAAPIELCRTVRHLMRSIASIERHMDTVLKQCDEWPPGDNDVEARKQMDQGLSEVDRKLMAMYRRLPEVHRRQLQVYRKQKKLSAVCMQFVGGAAPAPPPPGSPPPAPHHMPCRALCPDYHLQRFKEVRRKVMHMRDQQLYYHRLKAWLEDQLKQDRSVLENVEDAPRRRRRASSPRLPRLSTPTKRKLKPNTISKPNRILQLLRHKAQTTQLINDLKNEESKEADPPEPFPLDKEDNISDTDTIVGEKDDMNNVLATLAQMALSPDKRIQKAFADLKEEYANIRPSDSDEEYPESVSPPLQENSPTNTEPTYKQRLIVKKFTDTDAQTPELNVPLNARRVDEKDSEVAVYKDPNIYKYVTFGLEIKKAMEECQNIINSYNSIRTDKDENDGPLSLEQICEVMMSLDKNSAEFLSKIDTDDSLDMDTANTKLAELVENMPQILANMPEIASEFANASFELPEFASIMNSLPDANNEAQLTPETLKQIRELKLTRRDSVKVTKNTAKRKISRKVRNYIDTDFIGTMTFEFDSKDVLDLLNDEKELQALMKNRTHNRHDFRELLFSISAQVVVSKVFEVVKANKNPELAKCMEKELLALPRNSINSEMYAKASTLFDNSVKDALSMDELRVSVRARFDTWKEYVAAEFKSIPLGLLDSEIDAMLDKFYQYIKDLANKQTQNDRDKVLEKLEGSRRRQEYYDSDEDCAPSKESIKQITKILSVSAGNTFDLLLMKMSKMTGEKRAALKNMRFKYVDVLKRCSESQQLVSWILSDPDLAANHIQQLMGFAMRNQENPMDFSNMAVDKKRDYFMERLKEINKHFMGNIPRKSLSGDEWLVMLYRLEQFEGKIKTALVKFSPPLRTSQNASEAEILAAKGLSKIIGKANMRVVKKPDTHTPAVLPAPINIPISLPASVPKSQPTNVPINFSTSIPTIVPTCVPTLMPASVQTNLSGNVPISLPTNIPISLPTNVPIFVPTSVPISVPPNLPITASTNLPINVPIMVTTSVQTSPPKRILKSVPGKRFSAMKNIPITVPGAPESVSNAPTMINVPISLPIMPASVPIVSAPTVPAAVNVPITPINVPIMPAIPITPVSPQNTTKNIPIMPMAVPTSVSMPVSVQEATVNIDEDTDMKLKDSPKRKEVILKCESLIAQKGNKALKDSFDAIKTYLAGEEIKPENYHDHVMSIVSNLDYSALDDEMVEVLQFGGITISPPAPSPKENIKVLLPAHNPEELAKYSALALRNAKQTLNAVAFKNLTRNGQSKSESDISSCDVPSSECKYTSDCVCQACKRDRSVCIAGVTKISFKGVQEKGKSELEEKKKEVKEVKKVPVKSKPVPKQCENANHQQHVCKVGHTNNANGSCTGEGGDQHCTCCYCTVFGHAPPLTTPVPRNFNETRERLRSILNKKKQLCKTANNANQGDQNPPQESKPSPQPEKKPTSVPTAESPQPKPPVKVVQPQPKPPALPKTLPPNLTAQAQAKKQALDSQQRMLADKMAKMVVTEKTDKPVALHRTVPMQISVAPSLKAEGKVNPNAMEQIRLQQLKQAQYQQQIALIKKPEPIYDLPIHNKTPHQQQQIRQELHKQQIQKQLLLQQKLKQNPVVHINTQPQTPQQIQHRPILQQVPKPTLQQLQQSQQKLLQQVPKPTQPQPAVQQAPPVQQVQQKTTQTQTSVIAQQAEQKPVQQVEKPPAQQTPAVQQKPTTPATQQKPLQVPQKTPILQKLTPQQVQQKLPAQTINRINQAHLQNQQKLAQQQQQQQQQQPQLLQKPPLQQAPRKPPPQELQQKLAQKQQQPVQQKTTAQQTMPTQQKAQPVQQAPQQLQQRQSRQPQQNSVSLSSRDTSVFSTSSGCSDGSCWQGRAEDTRDLDALLQYIEGPTRHVDRGKKKAKKQRQKAKKTEERLQAECAQLKIEYARVRFEAEALKVAHYSAKRRTEETRKALQLMTAQNTQAKTRKKQNKLNPVQKQQIQVLAEQVGELTALMNTTAKELQTAEAHVTECSQRLRECEKEINEARAMQGKKTPVQSANEELKRFQHDAEQLVLKSDEPHSIQSQQLWLQQQELQERQLRQQKHLQMHQLKQQRQLQLEQQLMNRIRIDEAKLLKQRQNEAIAKADRIKASANGSSERGVSSSSVSSSAGSVSSTGADRGASSPASSSGSLPGGQRSNRQIIIAKHMEEEDIAVAPPPKKEPPKKQTQTWEQALAHINQLAKGKEKDKKKAKPAAPVSAESKPKETKAAVEMPALSKKQKKKIAQQQAEEEERIQQEKQQKLEAKKKTPVPAKKEPATPPAKAEPLTKKAEKKLEQAKRAEEAKTKKDAKRERKLEKKAEKKEEKKAKEKEIENKEKENKPEKNVSAQPAAKQTKPPQPQTQPQPQLTKKERKKEQQLLQQNQQKEPKPPPVNITPHTTIEVVNRNKNPCGDVDKPASCSIMEQLSCGIQVSELRLPPGITLTRVQPNEKKEAPAIKSVPLWKANQLPAAPTPVARPVPVINADPSMMMFSTAHPEQPPKPIIIAEPPPQPIGKSKKAKKKAKKAAAAAEIDPPKPEGTKMVTLRNPMFHPNLPQVQMSHTPPAVQITTTNTKKQTEQIRVPDPIPMPPTACQATITPTSNGMYTIRNPLMSMMHQQQNTMVRNSTPPFNQNQYYPPQTQYPGQYVLEARTSPKPDEYQNRIMNLASFTQKNDEGYSLFSTTDNQQKSFLSPEYYEDAPKPVTSPNPIGTRPEVNRYPLDDSLFANPIQRPEPIGTPLKRDDKEYTGLYTPFGVENPNLFRSALFNKCDASVGKSDDLAHLANGDLPYFQRLRVGSKLNNEVTIHHVTESKFYRQEPSHQTLSESPTDDSLFSRPLSHAWAEPLYPAHANPVISQALPLTSSLASPLPDEPRFGAVGTRPAKEPEASIFLPDASITNLSSLEACEREIESFKRFEWYFSPPEHKPRVQLHVSDIANSIRNNHK